MSLSSSIVSLSRFVAASCFAFTLLVCSSSFGQITTPDDLQLGGTIPPDVEQITSKALEYLSSTQDADGSWKPNINGAGDAVRGRECGVVALAMMAMLSTGEDPNSGPYAKNIHAALRFLLAQQNAESGFFPYSMYHHGFAMLALSEAYGNVDEELLWANDTTTEPQKRRSISEALQLAIGLAVNSQKKNSSKAWRYQPGAKDSDTSVAGAVLMGLFAARNAGLSVPDSSIEDGLKYMQSMTSGKGGETIYSTQHTSLGKTPSASLSAITCLTMKIGEKQSSQSYQAAAARIKTLADQADQSYFYYNLYYMGQALFQSDYSEWERWNKLTIRRLRRQQHDDGSFESTNGRLYATSMACLSLALNYRFLPIYER